MLKKPKLAGLIMAGGRSSRMGTDKALFRWHGIPQVNYLAGLLSRCGIPPFISSNPDQQWANEIEAEVIRDEFLNIGPMGGLLSAFAFYPTRAFLVVACDMPLLDQRTIKRLVAGRAGAATIAGTPEFPEPLLGIYEPEMQALLFRCFKEADYSLRCAIRRADCTYIAPDDAREMRNANTRDDLISLSEQLGKDAGEILPD